VLRTRRSGYTLFEIVLVMVVLVIVAALALPAIAPMMSRNQVQAASDLLRSRWTEMRTRAVADGRAYRFSIVENTGKFRIAPEDMEAGEGGDHEARPWVVEEALPGKVLFMGSQATSVGDHSQQSQASGGGWSRVVTFLADGTAREDVQVTFGQAGSRSLVLKLRGMTGAITAEEPGRGRGS
jgi:prepilin-type N-terminal cleavage/methylation domain-containing protein